MKVIALLCALSVTCTSLFAQVDYSQLGANRGDLTLDGTHFHDAYISLMLPDGALVSHSGGTTKIGLLALPEAARALTPTLQAEQGADTSGDLAAQLGRQGGKVLAGKVISVTSEGVLVDASEFALHENEKVRGAEVYWIGRGVMPFNSWMNRVAGTVLLRDYARAGSVHDDEILSVVVFPHPQGTYKYTTALLGQATVAVVSPSPPR